MSIQYSKTRDLKTNSDYVRHGTLEPRHPPGARSTASSLKGCWSSSPVGSSPVSGLCGPQWGQPTIISWPINHVWPSLSVGSRQLAVGSCKPKEVGGPRRFTLLGGEQLSAVSGSATVGGRWLAAAAVTWWITSGSMCGRWSDERWWAMLLCLASSPPFVELIDY